MRHKFNAKRTEVEGRFYPSKLEAAYANKLHLAKKSGDLLFWLEQVPFALPGCSYRLDFMEFWSNSDIVLTEVKGYSTPMAKLKFKLFSETYPFLTLNIVKK